MKRSMIAMMLFFVPLSVIASTAHYWGTFSVGQHLIIVNELNLHKAIADATSTRARSLALVDGSFSESALAAAGWHVVSRSGNVVTLEGTAATGPYLGAVPGIRYVKKPGRVFPQLDSARKLTLVDQVHGTRPGGVNHRLTGKKVLIGIIDTEFDTRHPAFLDSNGAIRFVAIWDQNAKFVNGNNSYGYGIIKNHAQIIADSLFGLDSNEVHGTMTASIAAGSDKRYWKGALTSPQNAYYGVAPDALLAGVKIGSTDADIVDALNWLDSLAVAQNLPCVVNMSLGDHDGPHDGTSLVDQTIDNNSTKARMGNRAFIVVGAAGNDGDKRAHIAFTVGKNETKSTWITPVPGNGTQMFSGIEMWGEAGKNFSVTFLVFDTTSTKRAYRQSAQSISTTVTGLYKPDTVVWTDSVSKKKDTVLLEMLTEQKSSLNNKPHCQAQITSTSPALYVGVSVAVSGSTGGTVQAWNLAKTSFESFGLSGFYGGDSTMSVNELGGTAKRNITVGAYSSKSKVWLWDGSPHDWGTDTTEPPNYLTGYSSHGPTVDNRTKPDITAPGSNLTCALSRVYFGSAYIVVWPDTHSLAGRYISTGGTSVAAPMVAGIVALLLQADSALTVDSVRTLLQESAINDAATGAIGANYNNRWGAGKVDALAAEEKLLGIYTGAQRALPGPTVAMFSIVKLTGGKLRLVGRAPIPYADIVLEVFSVNGRCVKKSRITKNGMAVGTLNDLSKGYYVVRAVRKGNALCSLGMMMAD
jgi:hypothetical protein